LKIVYVPVFRAAISYAVTLGRRWSLLDHMLLVELASARRSLAELSIAADLPERVVIESLINLLRAGWIEVRSDSDKANFAATPVGKRRATDKELQPELRREVKWTSLCMERLTGRWMRADDLELIYQDELPDGASTLEPVVSSLNYDDPDVRELISQPRSLRRGPSPRSSSRTGRSRAAFLRARRSACSRPSHWRPATFRRRRTTTSGTVRRRQWTRGSPGVRSDQTTSWPAGRSTSSCCGAVSRRRGPIS
jgi:hypothetical protein